MRIVATVMLMGAVPFVAAAQERAAAQAGKTDPTTDLKNWTVPYEKSRPRDPFVDQRGQVWFVGQAGNYVARLDPESGEFRKYEIEPGTHPHNLVVDAKGTVWFTGNRNGRIVKMDPATGKLTNYMMPDPAVRDPHTMTFDQNGDAWFTAQSSGVVGKLTVQTGEIRLWKLAARSRPYGIVIDSKGRPWFDEFGANRIGTIDPRTMQLREYTLPNERSRPRRIAVTADDMIWYGDFTQGKLGRLDPRTGKVDEWPLPSGAGSLPYGMASDDQGRIWLAETGVQPNRLVAFDSKSHTWVSSIVVPGTPNTIRHMTFDPKSREIWWGADVGTIGRIRVPSSVVP